MRADTMNILGISNMRRSNGTPIFNPGDGYRLRKVVQRETRRCPECDTVARRDEHGDTVCDDDACAVVLSDWDDGSDLLIYPEDDYAGSGTGSRSHSGSPLMRTPAITAAGPSGDDGL